MKQLLKNGMISLVSFCLCLSLFGCGDNTEAFKLPFKVDDIVSVEVFIQEDEMLQKKQLTNAKDIENLYKDLSNVKIKDEGWENLDSLSNFSISFRFQLNTERNYWMMDYIELESEDGCIFPNDSTDGGPYIVKNAPDKSVLWDAFDVVSVPADASERPFAQ